MPHARQASFAALFRRCWCTRSTSSLARRSSSWFSRFVRRRLRSSFCVSPVSFLFRVCSSSIVRRRTTAVLVVASFPVSSMVDCVLFRRVAMSGCISCSGPSSSPSVSPSTSRSCVGWVFLLGTRAMFVFVSSPSSLVVRSTWISYPRVLRLVGSNGRQHRVGQVNDPGIANTTVRSKNGCRPCSKGRDERKGGWGWDSGKGTWERWESTGRETWMGHRGNQGDHSWNQHGTMRKYKNGA